MSNPPTTAHHHEIDFKTTFTVTKEAGSQVKISGEIPFVEIERERTATLKKLNNQTELNGFRKGHIPENVLVKHLGEMAILVEMAERAVNHIYPHIIKAHDLQPIDHPKLEITKIAPGNPLGIALKVIVLPTVVLGNYQQAIKDLNRNRETAEITEEDVTKEIEKLQRQKMAYDRIQQKAQARKTAKPDDLPTPETLDEGKSLADLPLPTLTDEYVQSLGQPGQFSDVAAFKTKIKDLLTVEKQEMVRASHEDKIIKALLENSTLELPQLLIDSEIDQMYAQTEAELARAKFTMEDYLTYHKKTKEELIKEWTPRAEERARFRLVLNEVARVEHISPDSEEVKSQVEAILNTYKDADQMGVIAHVTSTLRNRDVFKKLAGL